MCVSLHHAGPGTVMRDVLVHAGVPPLAADAASASTRAVKNRNSRVLGHGKVPTRIAGELHALYDPFVERLYEMIDRLAIAVSPCEHRGTRFLDDPASAKANATAGGTPRKKRHALL